MDNWKISQNVDLARGCSPLRIWPDALMFEGDENAHTWEIQIMNDGKPADLDGTTCVVHFMRERNGENEDVVCDGSVVGNVASVKLKKECYIEGHAVGIFRLVSVGATMTLSKLAFLIGKGPTGVIIDPGSIIGDLDTLIAQIDAMEKATDEANAAADRANEAADRAESSGGVSDEQVGNAVAAYLSEHPVEAGATAEQAAQIEANKEAIEELRQSGTGAPGADGKDGQDGVSPTVTVEAIEGGHRVTITDANGTQSFDVMDGATGETGATGATGATGQAGADGKDGQDGVSPTVTVEAIEGGHRVTITDANGTQSFDVMDGADGKDGAGGSGSSVELDTTLTQSGKAADAKAVGDKLTELNEAKAQKADKRGYYMHISFDDVETCVGNLASGDYASIWDEPLFGWLKGLHEQYGAKFSLYVYNISQLSSVPDTYKPELMAASDWLKFGLHSNTTSGTYGSSTYAAGQTDWNSVVNQVVRFAGSHKSIDRIPRLNYFEGALNALKGMRDAECGALGFLCSDAERDSYYLSADQNAYLRTHDHLIDFANGLLFYQTDMRGDWFKSGFTSAYEYDTPTADNVYDELVRRFATPKYADTYQSLIWFAHEWQFYSGTTLNDYKVWTEDACRFAYDYGIPFDYPQNRIGINPTSFQFLSVTSSEDTTIETTGISLDKSTLSFTLSESQTLIATVEPSDSTQAVTWESSDNGVATVSGGIVNPVANGSCTITATSGAYSASCDVTVNIAESGGEETGTFLLSDYVTFEVGTGGYYTSADTYKLNINNARLSANIKPVEFAVGDVIDIGDYETYDCAIGTNEASTSANNRMWINGGYLGAPYTLVEADLLDAWVILIKRNDGANISQTDIDYINANAKVIRNA